MISDQSHRTKIHVDMTARILQAHCERIGDYLLCGEGVWWHFEENDIIFHDSEDDPDIRVEGPELLHFSNNNLQSISKHVSNCWNKCLEENITLPLKEVIVFDCDGDYVEKISTKQTESETEQPTVPNIELTVID